MNVRRNYLASLAVPLVIFFLFFLSTSSRAGMGTILTCSFAIFHDLAYVLGDGRGAEPYLIRSAVKASALLVCVLFPLFLKKAPLAMRIAGFACWLVYLAMNFFHVVAGV